MKVDLAVIGQGAVSPAGIGIDALVSGEPRALAIPMVSQPDKSWPVLRVDLKNPVFARWQREARLRRASPVSFFLVEAAEQALAGLSAGERKETGLIVCFSAGCIAYSRRFFEGIVTQGQRTASPALFPETVFNSPVSHVAAVFGLNGAAYAIVGDESSWVAAIKTASVWLRRGRVQRVLLLGAEEFDPLVLDAYRSARWLRHHDLGHGLLASEGAAGLLVRAATNVDTAIISSAYDGMIYRTKQEALDAAAQLVAKSDPTLSCYLTAQRNWLGPLAARTFSGRGIADQPAHPYLGEAFTASAAWNTIRALRHLNAGPVLVPIWGMNHQFASLELGKSK